MDKTEDTLKGRKVLITRERSQARPLSRLLQQEGAEPVECPLITFSPPSDWASVDRCLDSLELYDGVFFTSANAVRFFLERMEAKGTSLQGIVRIPCFAIGPATAQALTSRGLAVQALPDRFQAEGLRDLLKGRQLAGKRFLFPRAHKAREILPQYLEEEGARVDLAVVYETRKAEENRLRLQHLLANEDLDYLTFTSSSTVRSFEEFASGDATIVTWKALPAACLGNITAETARSVGFDEILVPLQATLPALVETIVDRETRRKRMTS